MINLTIDKDGTKSWRNLEGEFHRENGPAIIFLNGSMYWFINDKFHRIDGPAWVYSDGDKYWFLNDKWVRNFSYD